MAVCAKCDCEVPVCLSPLAFSSHRWISVTRGDMFTAASGALCDGREGIPFLFLQCYTPRGDSPFVYLTRIAKYVLENIN